MTINIHTKLILSLILPVVLSACGPLERGQGEPRRGENPQGDPPQGENPQGENNNPPNSTDKPEILTGDCQSIPVEDVGYSTNLDAPAVIKPGMVASGRIDPKTPENDHHYWDIEIDEPGNYHLVVDSDRSDSSDSNIGLEFSTLNSAGVSTGDLLWGTGRNNVFRMTKFISLNRGTLRLEVTGSFGMEDYFFTLLPNHSKVPSPSLVNCPSTITPISLGTTKDIKINKSYPEGEKWFSIDVKAADYKFTVDTTLDNGVNRNIDLDIIGYKDFGEENLAERIIHVNETGSGFRKEGVWNVSYPGKRWIRIKTSYYAQTIRLKIEKL